MPRPLGKRQKGALRALKHHRTWPGGWVWGSRSTTIAILESLVRRGLVEKFDDGRGGDRYKLTDEGRKAAGGTNGR